MLRAEFFPVVYPILVQIEALDLAAPQTLYATRDPGNAGEGSMKRGNKKILARGVMAGVVALAACVTATVGKAEERPLFVSTGGYRQGAYRLGRVLHRIRAGVQDQADTAA